MTTLMPTPFTADQVDEILAAAVEAFTTVEGRAPTEAEASLIARAVLRFANEPHAPTTKLQ